MAGIIPDSRAGRVEEMNLSGLNPFLGHLPLTKHIFLLSMKSSVTTKEFCGFQDPSFPVGMQPALPSVIKDSLMAFSSADASRGGFEVSRKTQ